MDGDDWLPVGRAMVHSGAVGVARGVAVAGSPGRITVVVAVCRLDVKQVRTVRPGPEFHVIAPGKDLLSGAQADHHCEQHAHRSTHRSPRAGGKCYSLQRTRDVSDLWGGAYGSAPRISSSRTTDASSSRSRSGRNITGMGIGLAASARNCAIRLRWMVEWGN